MSENQDPDYAYLINSLKLALGTAPSHIDHPGTTVQTIGALAIRGIHAIRVLQSSAPELPNDVLLQAS